MSSVSAAGGPRPETPRFRSLLAMVGVLMAVALLAPLLVPVAAYMGARGLEARLAAELRPARGDLERGGQLLEEGYRHQDPELVHSATASFQRSLQRFEGARRWTRLVEPARRGHVPGPLRARADAAVAVVDLGAELSEAALAAARLLVEGGLVGASPAAGAAQPGVGPLLGHLEEVRQRVKQAERTARRIDLAVLPDAERAMLAKARAALTPLLQGMERAWPSLPALLDVLGFDGPRTYLVLQANPAELRSGGGFVGTVSLVGADRGRVRLERSMPVEEFDFCDAAACQRSRPQPWDSDYVAPPPELAGPPLPLHSRLTAWSLQDSGFYPDFESNARTAAMFAERTLHLRPDGVIAIDLYAVAPVLEVTGAVAIPELELSLDAGNLVDALMKLDLDRHPQHKDVIGIAAGHVVDRISKLPPNTWPRLLLALQRGVAERHVQLWLRSEPAAAELRKLGWSEPADPFAHADFLMETEDNYGGSKANFFLDRRYRLALSRSGTTLHHQLDVELVDRAPAERAYIGPHYYAYVRLYVPATASNLRMGSAPSAEYLPILEPWRRSQVAPAGVRLTAGWLFIDVGEGYSGRHHVTFTYDTPWSPGAGGTHGIVWRKQPGTLRDPVDVTWTSGSTTWGASLHLATDQVIRLSEGGVGVEPAPWSPVLPFGEHALSSSTPS